MSLKRVRSAECYACYSCINGCPAPGALEFKQGKRLSIRLPLYALFVVLLFLVTDFIGRMAGVWHGVDGWQDIAYLLQRMGG